MELKIYEIRGRSVTIRSILSLLQRLLCRLSLGLLSFIFLSSLHWRYDLYLQILYDVLSQIPYDLPWPLYDRFNLQVRLLVVLVEFRS